MWIGGQNTGKILRTPLMDGPPLRPPAFPPRRRFRRHFCLADLLFSRPCAVAMERRSPSDSPARPRPPAHVSPRGKRHRRCFSASNSRHAAPLKF